MGDFWYIVVDVFGFIEGVSEGCGFGFEFFCYVECCFVLLYVFDCVMFELGCDLIFDFDVIFVELGVYEVFEG